MIIFKYIAKEVFGIFIICSVLLMCLFLGHQLAKYLGLAASGKLLGAQLIHLILLEIPQLLSLIFPLSIYLGFLLTYGRLYTDNEMVVMQASGLAQKTLLSMTFKIATCVAIPVMIFTLWLNPKVADNKNKLLEQITSTSVLQTLLPGRFQQANSGNQIYYIESMSADRQSLHNIFVAVHSNSSETPSNDVWSVMQAQNGYYMLDPHTGDHFAVAVNGNRYEGVPGEKKFSIYHFGKYGLRLNAPISYIKNSELDSKPTTQLFASTPTDSKEHLNNIAELQWRISLPLSAIILAFLAHSLSYVSPRGGRFAKLFPAILLYIIYANFMLAGQDWVSNGQLPAWLGLWSIHVVMIFIGILLFGWRENWFVKFSHPKTQQKLTQIFRRKS